MVRVEVEGVVLNLSTHAPVVILRSEKGEVLPIVIGIFEAQAILLGLEQSAFPRPLTHDLVKKLVEIFSGKMLCLEIHSIQQNVYHANLVLEINGEVKRLDCRPSDGIALALRFRAPVFTSENLLESPDTVKYNKGDKFLKVSKLDKPIDKKEAEEYLRVIENLSAQEFWRKLKEGK